MKRINSDPIRRALAQHLLSSLPDVTLSQDEVFELFVRPPDPKLGDLAFPCFTLAKTLRKAPPLIAQDVAEKMRAQPMVEKAQAAGPYVNFKITLEAYSAHLLAPLLSGEFFQQELLADPPRTMVEFSQPNTHKELHVGHMRNLCLGDSVSKLLRYAGVPLLTSTFPGDVGTHVAKCLWYLKNHAEKPWPETGKGEWLGRQYSLAHNLLEDQLGTPQEEKNRAELTDILKQIESQSGEYYELWKETRLWSIELMETVYQWAGVTFDKWYWESEMDSPSVKWVLELYEQGLLEKSQGAIGMNLEDEGLGFCLLVKSDGNGLYATKDLELARRKFEEGIEKSIYVVDVRQTLHFQQVFKVLERLGFENAKNCFHLSYNFVELPDGAMSSRKGNIVPIMRLIERMETKIKVDYLSRYQDWTQEEKDQTARQVAQGAIKYGMLKMDNNKKIVFDMDEWLRLDGDSGPFLQYSYARIQSILRQASAKGFEPRTQGEWEHISSGPEHELLSYMIFFSDCVTQAALQYRPSLLCAYLYQLAKQINHFYHECPILQAETDELRAERLSLIQAAGSVMEQGLNLLGIQGPERM